MEEAVRPPVRSFWPLKEKDSGARKAGKREIGERKLFLLGKPRRL